MVRMQLKDDADDLSRRTSLAWDKTRKPTKSILKTRSRSRYFSTQDLLIPNENNTTNHEQSVDTDELTMQTLLGNLSLETITRRQTNQTQASTSATAPSPTRVKAGKLYKPFTFEEHNSAYLNNSTSFTIRYAISQHRIKRLTSNQALISFIDIYDIPKMLNEVIWQFNDVSVSVNEPDTYMANSQANNIFYCNAYWVIIFIDAITQLVFDKLKIPEETIIQYNSDRLHFKDCQTDEHTHIIKEQLTICEWLTSTIAPNVEKGFVPYQLGPMLMRELVKLLKIINCENSKWIDDVINLLC